MVDATNTTTSLADRWAAMNEAELRDEVRHVWDMLGHVQRLLYDDIRRLQTRIANQRKELQRSAAPAADGTLAERAARVLNAPFGGADQASPAAGPAPCECLPHVCMSDALPKGRFCRTAPPPRAAGQRCLHTGAVWIDENRHQRCSQCDDHVQIVSAVGAPVRQPLTDEQIKHMVDRFLGWKLPANFSPDGGISFKATFNDHLPTPMRHEPSGTNLFDCDQATAMVRYMVEGLPGIQAQEMRAEIAELRNIADARWADSAKYKARAEKAEADKDEAYRQRNHLVAALARLFPSGIAKTAIPGWDPEWHGCVYIDLPSGQVSYHFHDREAGLFAHLPPYTKPWDGHDKETVHKRLAAITEANAPLLDRLAHLVGEFRKRADDCYSHRDACASDEHQKRLRLEGRGNAFSTCADLLAAATHA